MGGRLKGVAEVEGAARRRSLLTLGTVALRTAAEAYGIPKLRDLATTDASLQEVSGATGWDGGWDGRLGGRDGGVILV